jgi:hypothetical protein
MVEIFVFSKFVLAQFLISALYMIFTLCSQIFCPLADKEVFMFVYFEKLLIILIIICVNRNYNKSIKSSKGESIWKVFAMFQMFVAWLL